MSSSYTWLYGPAREDCFLPKTVSAGKGPLTAYVYSEDSFI